MALIEFLPGLSVDVPSPGATTAESARAMGTFLRDVMKLNLESRIFRLFSPESFSCFGGRGLAPDIAHVHKVLPDDQLAWVDGRIERRPSRRFVPVVNDHPERRSLDRLAVRMQDIG